MTISDWRKKIDEIDTVLLQLLNLRTEFAVEVARLKEEEGLSLCAPEREQKVIAGMKNLNDGPLDGRGGDEDFSRDHGRIAADPGDACG